MPVQKYDPMKLLRYLARYMVDNCGNPPTVRQMVDDCGLASTSNVYYQLKALQTAGYLKRNGRNIILVGAIFVPPPGILDDGLDSGD